MSDPRASLTVVDLLRARAAQDPDHLVYTYLVDGENVEERMTYGELDRRVRAVAAGLQARGMAPGERALLIYNSDLQFIVGFLACLYAGVVAVPAYPPRMHRNLPDQNLARLTAVALDCAPKLVLTSQSVLDRVGPVLPELPLFQELPVVATDPLEAGDPSAWVAPRLEPGTLAFLQYTSGSTGDPKGAMLTHGNVMANLRQAQWAFRMYDEPVAVTWLPLHHDMGLTAVVLGLYHGGHVVFLSPLNFIQRPIRYLRALAKYRGTAAMGPDFGFRLMLRAAAAEDVSKLDLSSLRAVYNGAEPIRADTLAEWTRTFAPCGFKPEYHYPCYGMAEATVLVSAWHPGTPPEIAHLDAAALEQGRVEERPAGSPGTRAIVGCGRSAEDVQVLAVDPDTLERTPPGRVGELWIAGPNVSSGYWRKPEINAAAFGARTSDGAGPFYRTGDLGFLRDGVVFITGRLKDLIIIEGRNHYPQDIERTVEEAHPQVRPGGGAAFSVDVDGIERLVVVTEVDRRARDLDVDAVARAIIGAVSVAHEITPREVVLLKAGGLPKTSSGKVQRRACRAALQKGELPVVGRVTHASA